MAGKTKQMIGKKFGMLTVLSVDEPIVRPNGTRSQMLKCKCDCGNETVVSYSHLKYGGTKSCGCAKHIKRYEDLTGKTFGKLTVIKRLGAVKIGSKSQYSQLWECVCECGNITKVNSRDLKSGNTVSCGCIQGEKLRESHLNKYDLSGEYGIGYFSDGSTFLFDKEDFKLIKDLTWYKNYAGYVITTYKNSHIRMHRLICNLGEFDNNEEVDHINHNVQDNRKCNLRVCSHKQNSRNKETPSNNTSGHIGVKETQNGKKYRAFIQCDGKSHELGRFDRFEDAVFARRNGEKEYFAEFAIERNE